MYRFLLRPAWLVFHAVVVGAVVLMVNLGIWQLDRLDERKDFNAQVRAQSQTSPVPLRTILDGLADGTLTPETAEWLPVSAEGTYLEDQVVEFNVSQGGRAGENVLTALALDDPSVGGGEVVIVNRGFIPLATPVPPPPATSISIVGYVRPTEVRERGGLTDADDGGVLTEVRRIDVARLAQQYTGDVAPIYVQMIGGVPAPQVGDPEPVVLPELSNGPHLSYAIQWFVFALCVVIGWFLAVRRSVRQRIRDREALERTVTEPAQDADVSVTA
ncbi:MAG: SURF1 family protein [Ilumatobacter sp.]